MFEVQCPAHLHNTHSPSGKRAKSRTYIADTGRPLGGVIEGAAQVEDGHMEALQEHQALLEGEDGRQTGLPLGLRQQGHGPAGPSSQPQLQAPRPGSC